MAGDFAVVVFVEFFVASFEVLACLSGEVFFEGEDVVFVGVPFIEGGVAVFFRFGFLFLGSFGLLLRSGGDGGLSKGFAFFFSFYFGVADEEFVFIDEVDEVVGGAFGELDGVG